ncbi:hypothetical protein ACIB24_06580 [Spongisporangium articulatum]|uniref:Uncharacterized protein n=1 Tax=Spongisporangium articulatum TaxID=3362603 RepID=A0ABW8AK34_9ACTN
MNLEQVLDAVRRLPDQPPPTPSPALAAFLTDDPVRTEIVVSSAGLGARRARRGLFAAKVALAAACLTATGVAAAGAVTGVGPVPRLPVLERHAPAPPRSVRPAVDRSAPPVKPSPAPVVVVRPSKPPRAQSDDDRPAVQVRHQHRGKGSAADGRSSSWLHRSGDDERPKRWPGQRFRHGHDHDRPGQDGWGGRPGHGRRR